MYLPYDAAVKIKDFAISKGYSFIAVFGSQFRGDANESSDIDLFFVDKTDWHTISSNQDELENILGISVDLVNVTNLSEYSPVFADWFNCRYKVIYGRVHPHMEKWYIKACGLDKYREKYFNRYSKTFSDYPWMNNLELFGDVINEFYKHIDLTADQRQSL